ncbi:MAG: hypothetical protein GWO24_11185, partial [Akkermansiaceae bacterium]|nr:hypothetical protein [Akkermansiaceae bacterium]
VGESICENAGETGSPSDGSEGGDVFSYDSEEDEEDLFPTDLAGREEGEGNDHEKSSGIRHDPDSNLVETVQRWRAMRSKDLTGTA